jgi:hypothetical protein
MFSVGGHSAANSNETYSIPELVSFTFTPSEIDLAGQSTQVKFELRVFHPIGIESTRVEVNLSSVSGNSLSLNLFRSETPVNYSLKTVTFIGQIEIPRDINNEAYFVSSAPVIGMAPSGGTRAPRSPEFTISETMNEVLGIQKDLIVRRSGELNYDYPTFVGPSHKTSIITSRDYPKLSEYKIPVWRVGEYYVPSDYYEVRVPNFELYVVSKNSGICESDGKKLKFIAQGDCYFTVSTPRSKNYNYREHSQIQTILPARTIQTLVVETIPNQSTLGAPKQIKIPRVYSTAEGYVFPKSLTPQICLVSDGYVNIFSGGVCKYTYQTSETNDFLASKIYDVSFEIIKVPQSISFIPPATANLSVKTLALSATSSSGGVITYQTTSTGICFITGSTLNLLKAGSCAITATQVGSATLAPISATATVMITGSTTPTKKTITCVKGNKTKKVSGTNPKCPKGYKVKR